MSFETGPLFKGTHHVRATTIPRGCGLEPDSLGAILLPDNLLSLLVALPMKQCRISAFNISILPQIFHKYPSKAL